MGRQSAAAPSAASFVERPDYHLGAGPPRPGQLRGSRGGSPGLHQRRSPSNFAVFAIAPGLIATEMTATTAERLGMSCEDFKTANANEIPVGRVGDSDDIANAVSFFADEAAGFVSSQVLYVAGRPTD